MCFVGWLVHWCSFESWIRREKAISFRWTLGFCLVLLHGRALQRLMVISSDGAPPEMQAIDLAASVNGFGCGGFFRARCHWHGIRKKYLELLLSYDSTDGGVARSVSVPACASSVRLGCARTGHAARAGMWARARGLDVGLNVPHDWGTSCAALRWPSPLPDKVDAVLLTSPCHGGVGLPGGPPFTLVHGQRRRVR